MEIEPVKRVNWPGLLAVVITYTVNLSILGFALVGNNQIGGILAKQFGWDEDEAKYNNTWINMCPVAGLMLGSLSVAPILKYGRRRTVIIMNFVAFFAVIMTLILNLVLICIGKFLFGFSSGALIVAASFFVNETVPSEHSDAFGFTTNFGVIIGFMICFLMGFALPDPD